MYVDVPEGRMHAVTRGSGTPVLILHGGGLDHRHMLEALEPVFESTSGWQRVYLDLPGHGHSTVSPKIATQDDVLGLIEAFADTVMAGTPFAVIGESRGSYHAMALAHRRPDALLGMMLVVADAMPDATVETRPPHQTLVAAPDTTTSHASEAAKARFERLVVQRADILDKIERTKVPAGELADQDLAARLRENFSFSFDLAAPDIMFDKPCLLVNGRQDAIAGYDDMLLALDRYPRATLAVLDRAGHSVSWEQPALFKALTLEWLDRMRDEARTPTG